MIEHIDNLEAGWSVRKKLNDTIDVANTETGTAEGLQEHLDDLDNPHDTNYGNIQGDPTDANFPHDALTNITPDDHHPQLHDLDSHTDVDLASQFPLLKGEGLWYDTADGNWKNRASATEAWPTGLVDGGELNISAVTDIEVIAGLGILVDSYTTPIAPSALVGVEWPTTTQTITAAPAVAGSIVWFSMANTGIPTGEKAGDIVINEGEIRQYAQGPNPSLQRAEIFLGVAIHNGVVWLEVSSPKVINASAETLREYINTVQQITTIIEGGEVTEQVGFQLDQAAGTVWENNRNWHVDKSDPNREALPAATPITFEYANRDYSTVLPPTTVIDPTLWDDNGIVGTVPGNANVATIQRLYIDPANNYWILLGQTTYPNFFTAEANLLAYTPTVPFLLQNSLFLGSIIAEKGKLDWDVNEAVFSAAGGGAGQSGGGGTPITDHDNLNGITPDNHHNQVHLLYGPDHSDVDTAVALTTNDSLHWDGDSFNPDRRTKALGDYVEAQVYNRGDEVYNGSDVSEALIDGVQSFPFVAPTGDTVTVYTGTMPSNQKNAKQVIFGNRYKNPTISYFINGYRVFVVAGNQYEVTGVKNPNSPAPVFSQISSFTASTTGWIDLPISSTAVPVGTEFDLLCTVSEPDPTPIEVVISYDYQTPQNPQVPLAGQIIQGRSLPSVLSISYTDAVAGDRTSTISALSIGDKIALGQVLYSVQTNTAQAGYANIVVAPALTTTPIGVQDVTFQTTAATPITIGQDTSYWPSSPFNETLGLLGVDIPYGDISPDFNAYGIDIAVQEAFVPDPTEWRLKVIGPLSGGGGTPAPDTSVPEAPNDGVAYARQSESWQATLLSAQATNIEIVAALPGVPDPTTLYFITG